VVAQLEDTDQGWGGLQNTGMKRKSFGEKVVELLAGLGAYGEEFRKPDSTMTGQKKPRWERGTVRVPILHYLEGGSSGCPANGRRGKRPSPVIWPGAKHTSLKRRILSTTRNR